jgi:multimeric flavodoxin WrbA
MNIITILGSPKKKGNTATVLSMFEERVQTNHAVERIHIARHEIGGCLGCMKCKEKKDEPGCVQKDDALTIFDKMIQADAIVYASPLYTWSFTAQIKPLIDRHFCLVSDDGTPQQDSLISGKPAALLVTCAGPIEATAMPFKKFSTVLPAISS